MRGRLALLILAMGCGRELHVDEGYACLEGARFSSELPVQIDGDVEVQVSIPLSCEARTIDLACAIDVDGDVVTIRSSYVYAQPFRLSCESMLYYDSTTCEVALEPGTYTFVYGDDAIEVDVPGELHACLSAG